MPLTPKRTYSVKPNPTCDYCLGSGQVTDWDDYRQPVYSTCECVYDNLANEHPTPEDNEDYSIVIDLSDWTGPVVPVDMEP